METLFTNQKTLHLFCLFLGIKLLIMLILSLLESSIIKHRDINATFFIISGFNYKLTRFKYIFAFCLIAIQITYNNHVWNSSTSSAVIKLHIPPLHLFQHSTNKCLVDLPIISICLSYKHRPDVGVF